MDREGIDPHRLRVAVHELGHAVVYRDGGLAILGIRVAGHGARAVGYVDLDPNGARTAEQARAYMAGLLAGGIADARWCELHGVPHDESTCSTDRSLFREFRRHPMVRDISQAAFRATARRLVRVHWSEITRRAPTLARRGTVASI